MSPATAHLPPDPPRVALALATLLPLQTLAQTDYSWLIYRADLEAVPATDLRLTDQAATYRDPRGQRRSLPRDQVLAILRVDSAATFIEHGRPAPLPMPNQPEEEPAPGPEAPLAEPAEAEPPMIALVGLTDGQAFRGRLRDQTPSAPETVLWDTPRLGTLILPLDRLALLRLDDQAPLPPPAAADLLTLSNGDRLEGFVARLQPTIQVEPTSGRPVELTPAQVTCIRFANPPSPTGSPRVWLGDGTIADVDALTFAPGAPAFAVRLPTGQLADVPPEEFIAARLVGDRLIPLGQLAARVEIPPERPWTPSARFDDPADAPLGLATIELPGPMRVTWTLPRGTSRLSLTAELPLDARLWGDATLTIALGDATLSTVRLSGDEPSHTLTLDLPDPARTDRALTVTLGEGRYGPIQDRAVLRRAVLLLSQGTPLSAP